MTVSIFTEIMAEKFELQIGSNINIVKYKIVRPYRNNFGTTDSWFVIFGEIGGDFNGFARYPDNMFIMKNLEPGAKSGDAWVRPPFTISSANSFSSLTKATFNETERSATVASTGDTNIRPADHTAYQDAIQTAYFSDGPKFI
jgi:hypothetical protein